MNIVLHHRERDEIVATALGAQSLDHGGTSVRQVAVDREMRVVLELELLLLLARQ